MLETKIRRRKRVRSKIFGTEKRPRLSVFRSSKQISAQLIDDENGNTLVSVKSSDIKDLKKKDNMSGKVLISYNVGLELAKKSKEKNLDSVIFDRGSYIYHGRVKALADGARKGGLKF
jgi:large subunit ribosomal protein L18